VWKALSLNAGTLFDNGGNIYGMLTTDSTARRIKSKAKSPAWLDAENATTTQYLPPIVMNHKWKKGMNFKYANHANASGVNLSNNKNFYYRFVIDESNRSATTSTQFWRFCVRVKYSDS
jgi:hypothetical protein